MKIPINDPDEGDKEPKSSGKEKGDQPGSWEPPHFPMEEEKGPPDTGELEQQLKERTEESENYYDRLMRLQADFENYKKRMAKEKAEQIKYANEGLIQELLSVLDDLDRAVALGGEDSAIDSLSEGIGLIQSKLKDILGKAGLEEVEAKGREFDPNIHEAVMITPAADDDDNIVAEEVQKGYMLSGKVIRPSKVVVTNSKANKD